MDSLKGVVNVKVYGIAPTNVRRNTGLKEFIDPACVSHLTPSEHAKVIALFNNFYGHYRNQKMDRNPPTTNQEPDLLTSLKYRTCFLRGPRHD